MNSIFPVKNMVSLLKQALVTGVNKDLQAEEQENAWLKREKLINQLLRY